MSSLTSIEVVAVPKIVVLRSEKTFFNAPIYYSSNYSSSEYCKFSIAVSLISSPSYLSLKYSTIVNNNVEIKIIDIPTEGYDNLEQEGDFVTYGLSDEEIEKELGAKE